MKNHFLLLWQEEVPDDANPKRARLSYPYGVQIQNKNDADGISRGLNDEGFKRVNDVCQIPCIMYVNFTVKKYGFAEHPMPAMTMNREILTTEKFYDLLWKPYKKKGQTAKLLSNNYLQSAIVSLVEHFDSLVAHGLMIEEGQGILNYQEELDYIKEYLSQIEISELPVHNSIEPQQNPTPYHSEATSYNSTEQKESNSSLSFIQSAEEEMLNVLRAAAEKRRRRKARFLESKVKFEFVVIGGGWENYRLIVEGKEIYLISTSTSTDYDLNNLLEALCRFSTDYRRYDKTGEDYAYTDWCKGILVEPEDSQSQFILHPRDSSLGLAL